MPDPAITLGTTYLGGGRSRFLVWAPDSREVAVHIVSPQERLVPLVPQGRGYWGTVAEGIEPGSLYLYQLDGDKECADPASRLQPQGVRGPSQVVASSFPWEDGGWCGRRLQEYVFYEIHVGTFTPEGTFEAIIPHLDYLRELGVTAVELMPVAQFPGSRNWGYDGVFPFAVQASYGGPEGLKRLVNICHRKGLAVVLDVIYNHLGPEGNCLANYGPYFTGVYRTPWGNALNFDGPFSDEVRRFFVENALYWVSEFHVDALRLDAVHAILDQSPYPFLEELAEAVHEQGERLGRRVYVIPESAANDPRLVRPRELGGFGMDAVWSDDYHHALHTLLTGEVAGYYEDYGKVQHLVSSLRQGFAYTGEHSSYRHRRHGASTSGIPAFRFVVSAQNHDQVGNRMLGERLSRLVSFEGLKLAAGLLLLSPFLPLLFMGEEYGETAPFLYFTSHSEPALVEAVRRGRKEEFAAFRWLAEPADPQAEDTFLRSRLSHALRESGPHSTLLGLYRELLRLRRKHPALSRLSFEHLDALGYEKPPVLVLRRWCQEEHIMALFHFGKTPATLPLPLPPGRWRKLLDSAEERWRGPGSPTPAMLDSERELSLAFPPEAFALFIKVEGA